MYFLKVVTTLAFWRGDPFSLDRGMRIWLLAFEGFFSPRRKHYFLQKDCFYLGATLIFMFDLNKRMLKNTGFLYVYLKNNEFDR